MLFILSKISWALFAPANLLLWLTCLSVACGLAWPSWGLARRGAAIALTMLVACALLPIGHGLLWPLEQRFPPPRAPDKVHGIIVLGGALKPSISAAREQVVLNDQAERMTEAVVLASRYPDSRIVFTGGSARIVPDPETEARWARTYFDGMGLSAPRMIYEDRSRNTFENAVFTRQLVEPREGETWLLVTSARHMPRAVGAFRAAGWVVTPWPVDFRTGRSPFDIPSLDAVQHLSELNDALHEWIGLVAYRAAGYSPSLLPEP